MRGSLTLRLPGGVPAQMGDPLENCAAVLGYERCLALLVEPLAQLSAQQAQGQPFDWRTAEATLFCVRCGRRLAASPCSARLVTTGSPGTSP